MRSQLPANANLLVALCLALLAMGAGVAPVSACSGSRLAGDPDPPADLIFTGTAVRVDDPADGWTASSMDSLRWTFAVDSVEVGHVGNRITVSAWRFSSSCGYEFQLGQRYLVRANLIPDATPVVWAHSGTKAIAALDDPPPTEGRFMTLSATLLGLVPVGMLSATGVGLAAWLAYRHVRARRSAHRTT